MGTQSRRDYLRAIKVRYKQARKKEKKEILDEFCKVCGYHRKHAIRLLNQRESNNCHSKRRKRAGRKKEYSDPLLLDYLLIVWKLMNLPCSKRLAAALPLWVPHLRTIEEKQLPEKIQSQLMKISASTIERLMYPLRAKIKKLGFSTTKPGSILKKHIPVRNNQWNEKKPGFLEADTVAHCGTSISGQFIYTVNTVDIATGWTEQRAVWGKGYWGVKAAIENIEQSLPFQLRGFDCDNGTEFLNWHLHKYLRKRKTPVQFTRSRPYQKNDNAHIEEKNWTIVRQYLGYNRFDDIKWVDQLNQIYTTEWRLLHNFFMPSVKLIEKRRIDGQIKKKYDSPKTPYQRVLESRFIARKDKQNLSAFYAKLNPIKLSEAVSRKVKQFICQTRPIQLDLNMKNVA